jgi:class III lanthionine synthetase
MEMSQNIVNEGLLEGFSTSEFVEYSQVLELFALQYKQIGNYYQVGDLQRVQGWILNISVVRFQIGNMIRAVVPVLLEEEVPFKVVCNSELALFMLEGNLGLNMLGKIMEIYPHDDLQAEQLLRKLLNTTARFDGPEIPTCAHLGGCIYTRYGAMAGIAGVDVAGHSVTYIYDSSRQLVEDQQEVPFRLSKGISWPYSMKLQLKKAEPTLLNGKYRIVNIINNRAKGFLAYAEYKSAHFVETGCIIKQGKRKMFADLQGRDVQDRLKWQYDVYNIVEGQLPVPRVLDFFEVDQNLYLVMEFIQGLTLDKYIEQVCKGTAWANLRRDDKVKLLECLLEVINIVKGYHKLGLIHRDLNPSNIMVDQKGKIFLIDLELSYSSDKNFPNPPFALGTTGFISPEQWESRTPSDKEDIYGLGALMILFFIGLSPVKFTIAPINDLNKNYLNLIVDNKISEMIYSCLSEDPGLRPDLKDVERAVLKYMMRIEKDMTAVQQIARKKSLLSIDLLITNALNGLAIAPVVDENGFWLSKSKNTDESNINVQKSVSIYRGLHTGIGGVLYLIAMAKENGFCTAKVERLFYSNLTVLLNSYNAQKAGAGLFYNDTSLALIIDKAIEVGLIPEEDFYLRIIADEY